MIDYKDALALMKKYGYMSTTTHPYLYKSLNQIGVCYCYNDSCYGMLERIKIFNSLEQMENFLSRLHWVEENGVQNHVRMILDNYEVANPKNIFLHQDKTMGKGEMFDLSSYEKKRQEEDLLDPVSKLILEAGRILVYYDEIKNKRIAFSKAILELENELRKRYLFLQQEIDKYNGNKVHRELVLLPIIEDTSGINFIMENSIKERYTQYKSNPPSLEEATQFISEVWSLLMNLEIFPNYFHNQQRERELYNEMRVVQAKTDFILNLNSKKKELFSAHLMQEFRKINQLYKKSNLPICKDYASKQVEAMEKKYSFLEQLDSFHLSDYLKESVGNTNYGELLFKYKKNSSLSTYLTPKQVSSRLLNVYKNNLSIEEQAVLLLYHSVYKDLLDYLLCIPDLFQKNVDTIAEEILKNKTMISLKKQCYDGVKYHLEHSINANVKQSVFKDIDFTSFSSFIGSLIHSLSLLKNINNKMRLEGDLVMYSSIDELSSLQKRNYLYAKQSLSAVQSAIQEKDQVIVLLSLKKDTPVLFCPYHLDLGNLLNQKEEALFQIVYMKEFNLFIDFDDVIIGREDIEQVVSQYNSLAKIVDGATIVEKIKLHHYNRFIKLFLHTKFNIDKQENFSKGEE